MHSYILIHACVQTPIAVCDVRANHNKAFHFVPNTLAPADTLIHFLLLLLLLLSYVSYYVLFGVFDRLARHSL